MSRSTLSARLDGLRPVLPLRSRLAADLRQTPDGAIILFGGQPMLACDFWEFVTEIATKAAVAAIAQSKAQGG